MKLKSTLLFSWGLAFMLLFVSCQSETESAITPSSIDLATSTMVSPSSSKPTPLSALPSATPATKVKVPSDPVLDLSVSATITPETATPSPTLAVPTIAIVTLTPLPTFTANELEPAIEELLANPMNCDVPCWWGAVPNETTVFEIQQFLALYQLTFYQRDDNPMPDYIELWENENLFDFSAWYSFEDHQLKIVYARQSPPISEILKKYGQPDEVWISTMSFERERILPVRLNLVYLQKGMAVGYMVNGDIQDDMVIGCFADETGNVRLNPPNSATSYKDFSNIFFSDFLYLTLEEAVGLTMDDFVQQFSDSTQSQCIETPTELWD